MQYPHKPADDVLTTDEVAAMLKVHRETIRRYREDHGLPGHNLSDSTSQPSWRYIRADVLDWLRSRCSAPVAAHELDEVAA